MILMALKRRARALARPESVMEPSAGQGALPTDADNFAQAMALIQSGGAAPRAAAPRTTKPRARQGASPNASQPEVRAASTPRLSTIF
jgi:hypothetical protein